MKGKKNFSTKVLIPLPGYVEAELQKRADASGMAKTIFARNLIMIALFGSPEINPALVKAEQEPETVKES